MTATEKQYQMRLAETLNAAEAYAAACDRCGAQYSRLDLVRFCARSCEELTAVDALAIADATIGRRIPAEHIK